jgi:hypothetical protein
MSICYVVWTHQSSYTFHVLDEFGVHAGVEQVCRDIH